ncbi:MAG: 4Fe-4S binding protein [Clostridia bacterium]|nr:4Fe-4S binding protein [Clostridia bacterium]
MEKYLHSVTLVPDKCHGCTHCLNFCPTEAIRIRDGKAVINPDRCIDCGQCIRVCKNKAKKAVRDGLEAMDRFKFKIALPAPTLYSQFNNLDEPDYVVQGLYDIGFDHVYEVSRAAEIVSEYTRRYLESDAHPKPIISSACPVILRLISLRFPSLCGNVMPLMSPMELAAIEARREVKALHPDLAEEDIGVCFISPCPAKVSYVKNNPENRKPLIDCVISIKEIYFKLIAHMSRDKMPEHGSRTGVVGLSWATSGGESTAVFNDKYLAADGIENVIAVLDQIENNAFPDLEFIELNSCPGGCVGGVMTVANPFIAKARLRNLRRYLPITRNFVKNDGPVPEEFMIHTPLNERRIGQADPDDRLTLQTLREIEALNDTLPQIDCGACGAPTCHAFAEDVIRGFADPCECVIVALDKTREQAKEAEE